MAAEYGKTAVCEFICENMAGKDLMVKDDDGRTPFHVAAIHNRADICKIMSLEMALR